MTNNHHQRLCYSNVSGSPCCYNEYLIESNQSCVECPIGTFGWNCKLKCKDGYYGRLCNSECGCSPCNHVTGCDEGTSKRQTISQQYFPNTAPTSETQVNTKIPEVGWNLPSNPSEHEGKQSSNDLFMRSTKPIYPVDHDDIHLSHEVSITLSVIGLILSISFLGYFLHNRSRKRKLRCFWTKHQFDNCADSDYQRQENIGDIELSTVHRCTQSQQEMIETYDEIRYSRIIEEPGRNRSFLGMASEAEKRHPTLQNSEIYQHCKGKDLYDRVRRKLNRSVLMSDRRGNISLNLNEKYVTLGDNNQKDDIKRNIQCCSPNLETYCMAESKERHPVAEKSVCSLSASGLLKNQFTFGNVSQHCTGHPSEQNGPTEISEHNVAMKVYRPYSLAHSLTANATNEKQGENSNHVKQQSGNNDQPGINVLLAARPYSFAKSQ